MKARFALSCLLFAFSCLHGAGLTLTPASESFRYKNDVVGETARVFSTDMVVYRPFMTQGDRDFITSALTYFAKGVYEASDGKHKIGTIRVYVTTNTVWNANAKRYEPSLPSSVRTPGIFFTDVSGWPCAWANVHGGLASGGPIWLFGKDESWSGNGVSYTDVFSRGTEGSIKVGLSLAHEWGHAVYGFRDEYVYKDSKNKIINAEKSVQSLMGSATRFAGTTVYWDNINFSIQKGNGASQFWTQTGTKQHEQYGHSCWSRLIGLDSAMYKGKSAYDTPTFENATAGWMGRATSELEVKWMGTPLYGFCIDTSGSMATASRIDRAKSTMISEIAKLPKDSKFAIEGFDSTIETLNEFILRSDYNFSIAKSKIQTLQAGGGTRLWDAIDAMVAKVNQERAKVSTFGFSPATIFVLTDGEDNESSASLASVISRCNAAGIRVHPLSYGSSTDKNTLDTLASKTSGKHYSAGDSVVELTESLSEATGSATGRTLLTRSSTKVGSSGSGSSTIRVDSSLSDFVVTMSAENVPVGGTIKLVDPKTKKSISPTASSSSGGSMVYTFVVDKPSSGGYNLTYTKMAGATVSYRAEGTASTGSPRIDLYRDKSANAIYARVTCFAPVSGVSVVATVYNGSSKKRVALSDKGGGLYKLDLGACGNITGGILVEGTALAGKAKILFSSSGIDDHRGTADASVSESFVRSAFLDFSQRIESTVVFDARGGTVSPKRRTGRIGSTFAFPIPVRKGYAFNGWYRSVPLTTTTLEEQLGCANGTYWNADTVVYAKWSTTRTKARKMFHAEGGKLPLAYFRVTTGGYLIRIGRKYYYVTKDRKTGGKMLTVGKKFGTLPKPTRKGYSFAGWYTAASGGTKVTSKTIVPDFWALMELHAHWKAKKVKVSFVANGGKSSFKKRKYTFSAKYGTLPTAKRSGYKFAGWWTKKTGGTRVYASSAVTLQKTLYAHWVKNSYVVTFNANGGKLAKKKKSKRVTYGKALGSLPEPTKKGYAFLGWYSAKKGGKKVVSTSKADGVKKLYAHWIKGYTVTFVFNDGTARKTKVVFPEKSFGTYSMFDDARPPSVTRAGYTFEGWYLKRNSTSNSDLLFASGSYSSPSAAALRFWSFNWPRKAVKSRYLVFYEYVRFVTVYATWEKDLSSASASANSAGSVARKSFVAAALPSLQTVAASAPQDENLEKESAVLYVSENGRDTASGLSPDDALSSIQRAVDMAEDGMTILVLPGVYASFDTSGKRLTILGESGAEDTVVIGAGTRCASLSASDGSSQTVVKGLALRFGTADFGGGARGGTLVECVLEGNSADVGGGAYGATLVRCSFRDNAARLGDHAAESVLDDCVPSFEQGSADTSLYRCTTQDVDL